MRHTQRFQAISLVLLASLGGPVIVRAADASSATTPGPAGGAASSATASAQQHFERGNAHYNLSEWDAAIAEYKAAYLLDTQPKFLFAIAQAERLKGDCEAAIKSYQAFKRTGPSEEQTKRVDALIRSCEDDLKAKSAAAASAASTQAPPIAPAASSATSTVAAASAPAPAPAPPKAPEKPGPWYGDVLGNALFWTGIVAAGVGGTLLFTANHDMSNAAGAEKYWNWHSQTQSVPTRQTLGVVGLAAGGALVGLGIWRFAAVGSRADHTERSVGVSVGPGSFSLSGSF